MNILYKDGQPTKYIWIAPERTGTRLTNLILKDNGYIPTIINSSACQGLDNNYTHSHTILPQYYKDYTLICNIRNPYKRLLSSWKYIDIFNRQKVSIINNSPSSTENNEKISDIFLSFVYDRPFCQKNKIRITAPNYKTFDKFILNFKNQISDLPRTLKLFDSKYIIRMESLTDDLKSLPFIKSVFNFDKQNYTSPNDKILLLRNHFVHSILKDNDFDCDYYKKYIELSFSKTREESDVIIKFYNKICNLSLFEKNSYVSFVKNNFEIDDYYRKNAKLFDILKLHDGTQFYSQELADQVYEANILWFKDFGYQKDSWN